MSATKIRVKIASFDHTILEVAVKKLIQVVIKAGGKVTGPIPLKTKKKLFSLRRSTFVYSKHADKIESREHRRLVDITSMNNQVISSLSSLSLPAGVDIVIQTL